MVAITGAYYTKFGEIFEKDYKDLLKEAVDGALKRSKIDINQVDAIWLSTFDPHIAAGSGKSGASFFDSFGGGGIPVSRNTNYCASGTDAFRNAWHAVLSGKVRIALVVGVEKMRDVGPRESLVRAVAEEGNPIYGKGLTAPGMFALRAKRYMAEYGIDRTPLAKVAVKNHKHGALNPKAHFRKEIGIEKVLNAPMVSSPLGLFDCCPTTDGAACCIITDIDTAHSLGVEYILVRAVGMSTRGDLVFFDPTERCLNFDTTRKAAKIAYEQAGIKDPKKEIDVAEVHDCFTITEILNYEDLGFTEDGKGYRLIEDGKTYIDGSIPVNPSGGLKTCGHPIGATGVRMITEIYEQLLCKVEKERQVKSAKTGLVHNLGGPGSVATVIVLSLP